MSLKAFHVAFIFLSTVLSAGFSLWCFREMSRSSNTAAGVAGAVSALAAAGLIVYGVRFLRKSRGVGYL